MALPASGEISMSQVNTELGRGATTAISLGDAAVRTLAGKPSGTISMSDLHGKSSIWRGIITVGRDVTGTDETAWYGYNVGSTEWITPAFGSMSDRSSPVGTVMNFAWRYWGNLTCDISGLAKNRLISIGVGDEGGAPLAWSTIGTRTIMSMGFDPDDTNPTGADAIIMKKLNSVKYVGGKFALFLKFP